MALTRDRFFRATLDPSAPVDDDVLKILRLSPRMLEYLRQVEKNLGGKWVVGTNFRWSWTMEAIISRRMAEDHRQFGWILSPFGERVRQKLIDDGVITPEEHNK